ncbi:MAG: glycosyltransferase family 2 protein [Kiritimatiellaeota bacterium]|nr:glycosyltransferase family 2 protein [Kiritimatiellota bacterium]
MKKTISIIVSVFNEAENLPVLFERLEAAELPEYDYEYVFVDDGSTDASTAILRAASERDDRIKVVSFTRNFGHEIAMTAGLDFASGDAAVFMDADLQHPPEVVPKFIRAWRSGHRIVLGKRLSSEQQGLIYRWIDRAYYKVLSLLADFDATCNYPDFRLLDRHYLDVLRRFKEHSRLFRGFVYWIGAGSDTAEVPFSAPARFAGTSKYGFRKLASLGLDAIYAFSLKPMRLALLFAVSGIAFALALAVYHLVPYFLYGAKVPGYLTVVFTIIIMGSLQLFILAIFAEYIGRMHIELKDRPLYVVRYTANLHETE